MTPQQGAPRDAGADWTSAAERGSRLALRLLVGCFRRIGRAPMRLLLAPIASYYCLFAPAARRASRDYLGGYQ